MSSSITATTDPKYGVINGYTTVTSAGLFGNVASVITAKTGDIVQFVNVESGTTPIAHSAVGFLSATTFPPTPYSFASSSQSPVGTSISQQPWSTGLITSVVGVSGCFSQTFTLSIPGTYYFGDYTYYNTTNMRDVIVVN